MPESSRRCFRSRVRVPRYVLISLKCSVHDQRKMTPQPPDDAVAVDARGHDGRDGRETLTGGSRPCLWPWPHAYITRQGPVVKEWCWFLPLKRSKPATSQRRAPTTIPLPLTHATMAAETDATPSQGLASVPVVMATTDVTRRWRTVLVSTADAVEASNIGPCPAWFCGTSTT